jgi:hypothetical protein
MSARVIDGYTGAGSLGVDARGCLALAVAVWDGLSMAQRSALTRSHGQPGDHRIEVRCNARVRGALTCRGLVRFGSRDLTMLGELVLEQGRLADFERVRARRRVRRG